MPELYYLDTEFAEYDRTIDLVSIGIVCQDGREYYAQSVEYNYQKASSWVKENVLPHLHICPYVSADVSPAGISGLHRTDKTYHKHYGGKCMPLMNEPERWQCPWRTLAQMRQDVQIFFNPSDGIELRGWCSGYDFVVLCQIFGGMMDLPAGWPHYIKDFQCLLDERGISDNELPQQQAGLHNALADAHHLKRLWDDIAPIGRI